MYDPTDTIVAVSSPTNNHNVIIRITGSQAIAVLKQIYKPGIPKNPGISTGKISITPDITLDAVVYLFRQPHSYTGDDLAEIHLWSNQSVTETLMQRLLSLGVRPAEAGEFTARAYLNNKIDLAQAEAVNEVITSSNTFQLAAAENLLAGQFGQTLEKIVSEILDLLSRLEAGLDFSTEDLEPQNQADITASIEKIINRLRELLNDSIRCESTLDLPAVGIAGSPNAGKSTLLNKLLGQKRSIVSHQRKTTRDVLTGEINIENCRCVLFDCAGLTPHAETILDELAQQAAIQALQNATVVVFCIDLAKPDWAEDLDVWKLITPKQLIPIATKCDLLPQHLLSEKTSKLKSLFGFNFLPISAHTGSGLDMLKSQVADRVIAATSGQNKEGIALTARHRQVIIAAIADLEKAVDELKSAHDELAAMMLRSAHNQLNAVEQHNLDEQVLDR
ncbi:MAG: GTPase, partial [Sedimentisphaerales bacterium]